MAGTRPVQLCVDAVDQTAARPVGAFFATAVTDVELPDSADNSTVTEMDSDSSSFTPNESRRLKKKLRRASTVVKIKEKLAHEGLGEHASLSESVRFLCDSFDSIKLKQDELTLANKELVAQNEVLTRRGAELEQYSRLNNVEIKGVPVTQGEDCAAIVKRLGEAIQCPVRPSDVVTVHRVSTKTEEKNIVVRFCCRDKKNDFVRKARKSTCQILFTLVAGPECPRVAGD
ncbi:hypothetical protein HPB49_023469 [Dermacentor silvarum]|uniref:Uncharacterized protein n=1 Tax=Dermacentor silvarum TaxID=543639 RepID=A0ACB8DGP1_DERSI|nr:hypothetical protein HPB49_023469 [Dermacentor silvarum]